MSLPDLSVDKELSWEELRKKAMYLNIPAWKLAEDLAVHSHEEDLKLIRTDL